MASARSAVSKRDFKSHYVGNLLADKGRVGIRGIGGRPAVQGERGESAVKYIKGETTRQTCIGSCVAGMPGPRGVEGPMVSDIVIVQW